MTRLDVAALLTLAAAWGGSYLFIRVAVPELGAFPLMLARVALGAAILVCLPAARRDSSALCRHWRPFLVLGATNAAIPFSLIATAELHVTASLAAILTAAAPLFSAMIEARWEGERVGARRVAGLALGVAGVVALVGWSPAPASGAALMAVAAILIACSAYAFAGVYARRRLAGVQPASLALGQQLGAAAWLVAPALLTFPTVRPSGVAVAAVLALATISTAIAYLLYFRLLGRIGATRTSMVTYLIPIFGTAWGALFLGETVSVGMLGGMAVVLASVVMVNGIGLPAVQARWWRPPGAGVPDRGAGRA